jgi:hypothetical protein
MSKITSANMAGEGSVVACLPSNLKGLNSTSSTTKKKKKKKKDFTFSCFVYMPYLEGIFLFLFF